ncbi:MAG: phosphoribosylglycinamide formyltransferase [Candidatus Muiribacteriota bacterium]
MKKGIILVSGRGSNMMSIIEAVKEKKIKNFFIEGVYSDKKKPTAFKYLREKNIKHEFLSSKIKKFEKKLSKIIEENNIDYIILAGFMRILTPEFVSVYKNQIINIHPSLLPSFPGLNAQKQAWDYGVKYTGVTVHFVDEGVDTGKIIYQNIYKIKPRKGFDYFKEDLLKLEHKTYIEALQKILEG